MISIRVICAAFVGILGLLPCNTVLANEKSARAAYGEAVPDELMSYFVSLMLVEYHDSTECGGALLQPGWVITAAHCVIDFGEPILGIAVVLHEADGKKKYIVPENVTSIFVPEEYSPETQPYEEEFYGDIALIRIEELEDISVSYPRLPNSREEVDQAPVVVAAGVGLDHTQREADELEFVTVAIISGVGETPDFAEIPLESDHFATLDLRGEDQDTCGGDSGGGLFIPNRRWSAFTEDPELDEHSDATDDVQDILVGITSYGDGKFECGDEGTFGVYTDVLYWKDWIKRTIAENS